MTPIIDSLLDTDLYKFTMWQAMLHRNPQTRSQYTFLCRNKPAFPLAELAHEVSEQIDHLCSLQLRPDELAYLSGLRFMKSDFIDFLRIFRFQRDFISVLADGPDLQIVAEGPQVHVMGFEIFVLAIVNELYFRRVDATEALAEGRQRLNAKLALLDAFAGEPARAHPFEMFDFGVRRRYSGAWQAEVVATLKREAPRWFKGTSNVMLAKALDLVPIGTMAHEYMQSYQAHHVRLRDFQKAALEDWVQEYRGDLGVALTDVVGMNAFVADFDLYFAKLFDGLRHDSGDPIVWGEKALARYAQLRIDAHTKRLVFSDGLDIPESLRIYRHFAQRTQLGFGIGTNLTNDMGHAPLHIVMKLTRCNGQPVAKLSDSPGKTMCDDETFLAYLRQVFDVPAEGVTTARQRPALAVCIGRFEPLLASELSRLRQALLQAPQVVVVIGSAFQARTPAHPWTWQERAAMIRLALPAADHERLHLLPVRDCTDDERWQADVRQGVARVVAALGGCTSAERAADGAAAPAVLLLERAGPSQTARRFDGWQRAACGHAGIDEASEAAAVRDGLFDARPGNLGPALDGLGHRCPPSTLRFLQAGTMLAHWPRLTADWRELKAYHDAWRHLPHPPTLVTVDVALRCNGHVLLIRRGRMPNRGLLALPGGFIEARETLLQATLRELREETGLVLPIAAAADWLAGVTVFDHPGRGQRGRSITHVHRIELAHPALPQVTAADDAQAAFWVQQALLPSMEDRFHDDHFQMLEACFASGGAYTLR